MASDQGKENIADGLVAGSSLKAPAPAPAPAPSPKKSTRKTRSKSIGPGGLGALDEPPLKESSGNRRKSAFIPAVKSILASNDVDEKKRREARRRSLARRRVSFAPEATLHTWDVVEYLRDATSSSAASESTRRASTVPQASNNATSAPDSDAEEPPSTPPERVEEPKSEPGSSPANQRDLHQKKNRRRSSGIPPMNFNNPDDILSSSPLSGDNASPGAIAAPQKDLSEDAAFDDSPASNDDSQSSARLDAALRQAVAHAGTQKLDLDNEEDLSMVMAEDDVTASFKPWAQKEQHTSFDDQENEDPFSNAFGGSLDGGDEDMSMDITRAVGRIIAQPEHQSPGSEDVSMDLTMALGSIQTAAGKEPANRRKSLKRRVSMLEPSQGSPAKRNSNRRASLRHQAIPDEIPVFEDQTMELTMAIGAIKSQALPNADQAVNRRSSVESSLGDETMDFTMAVGTIKDVKPAHVDGSPQGIESEEDEDMSMEFTSVVGPGIRRYGKGPEIQGNGDATVATGRAPSAESPTPQKSPRKSPGRPRLSGSNAPPSSSPRKPLKATPVKSPRRPRRSLNIATPETRPIQQNIEDFEPSPFVRSAPQSASKPTNAVSTPTQQPRNAALQIPDDPIAAPILNRRRSSLSTVQFSPLAAAREEPTLRSTAILTNNIKLLSTPRKQTLTSPVKRGMTPKKSQTPQKEPTPRKSMSPRKKVAFGEESKDEEHVPEQSTDEVERISLQEFLDLTRIRFMDLSTTKRRHTAAPAAFHDKEIEEQGDSLDQYVIAGACTLPEFELYQHACHEMKKYISDGRHFVRTMEANVMEENPMLFTEYLTAPPDQRMIMDNQFKNLKTNARLEARGEWYGWRSTLLQDLKSGLLGTMDGFKRDESLLTDQEKLLDVVLPPLIETQERLNKQCQQLQQRHDELNSCDREELEQARQQLVTVDAEVKEKRKLITQLQEELSQKEARIEAVKERKIECVAEIKAAERVREECRGWSTTEVNELNAKVTALEQSYGWSITSASSNMVTLTYMNDLELYLQPSAFATGSNTANASISLTYVGDSSGPHPRPLTTSKRFFLQLIRAHLHCIPQSQSRIAEVLKLIKNGWATALAVAEGVRLLEHSYITEETILSDERMAVSSNMLLPTLQTKIKVTFEIGVSLGAEAVETEVSTKAELVYGEKYNGDKMSAFLGDFCGVKVKEEKDMSVWADAVLDLAGRLKATGKKGERV